MHVHPFCFGLNNSSKWILRLTDPFNIYYSYQFFSLSPLCFAAILLVHAVAVFGLSKFLYILCESVQNSIDEACPLDSMDMECFPAYSLSKFMWDHEHLLYTTKNDLLFWELHLSPDLKLWHGFKGLVLCDSHLWAMQLEYSNNWNSPLQASLPL